VASLTVDVVNSRAARVNLEDAVPRLQNEAIAANYHRQAEESALSVVREALERQVTGLYNLRIAVQLVTEDLGMEPAGDPVQLAAQLV